MRFTDFLIQERNTTRHRSMGSLPPYSEVYIAMRTNVSSWKVFERWHSDRVEELLQVMHDYPTLVDYGKYIEHFNTKEETADAP